MQTEIVCCLLGAAVGIMTSLLCKAKGKKSHMAQLTQKCKATEFNRLEKLLHNIESYDGTEKNQLQIGIEEE